MTRVFQRTSAPTVWCSTVAGLLAVGIAIVYVGQWNIPIFYGLNQLPLPGLWTNLTELGDGLILGVLLFPLIRKKPYVLSAFLIGIVVNTLVVQGLKTWLAVPRPAGVLDPETIRILGPVLKARAFPSGHSATIFLAAAILSVSVRTAVLRGGIVALAVLVALSRAAVGAHWPLDILTGSLIGWAIGCAVAVLVQRRGWYPVHRTGVAWIGGIYVLAGVIALFAYPAKYPWTFLTHTLAPLVAWGWGTLQWIQLLKNPFSEGNKQTRPQA